jgi:hypothetical protein
LNNKQEYLVHIWGGAFNNDAYPSITKDYGISQGYYYFDTKEEKDSFIQILKKPEYNKQGLVIDEKYGYMTHKRTIFVGKFNYNNKDFLIHYDFGYEYPKESAEFSFLENNYSCDCNRSLFIRREYGEDAIPELNCGDEIKLLEYHFEYLD